MDILLYRWQTITVSVTPCFWKSHFWYVTKIVTCNLQVEDTSDVKSNFFCLLWPEIVVHSIDRSSPLYDLSADDLQMANFEILVIMEGTIESTDQRVQARTSYLPAEILWGHRFEPVVSYDERQGRYNVDYNRFHSTQLVETPRGSARQQYESLKMSVTNDSEVWNVAGLYSLWTKEFVAHWQWQ